MTNIRWQLFTGIFLLSTRTLVLEPALTRVLSVANWYHFGFLVISTSRLGFGAHGVTLSLWTKLREETPLDHALAFLALLFGFVSLARPDQSEVAKTTRLANRAHIAEEFDSLDLAQAWSGSLSPRLRLMLSDLVPWEPRGC